MTRKRAARDTSAISPRFEAIAKAPVRENLEFADAGGGHLIQVNLSPLAAALPSKHGAYRPRCAAAARGRRSRWAR